jgi:hypothetical protein
MPSPKDELTENDQSPVGVIPAETSNLVRSNSAPSCRRREIVLPSLKLV